MDRTRQNDFQRIYEAIFMASGLNTQEKRRTLDGAIAQMVRVWTAWEIVGISRDAIDVVHENRLQDRRLFSGINRGHRFERSERGELMFNVEVPIKNAGKFYFEHDKCVLITKKENSTAGTAHWTNIVPLEHRWFSVGTSTKLRKKFENDFWERLALK